MGTIRAIYENGVFRPLEPIDLAEGSTVELCDLQVVNTKGSGGMDAIYEILDRRHSTAETDLAERHNEHQP